jgi:molybdopterin-guanine dinucleotide biosynthesis protein A
MTADASGIVLAGGRSVRFGGDKLAALIDGRALLDRAVDPLAEICREVIVVVAPGDRSRRKRWSTRLASIRVVQEIEAYRGPLAGLATGLEAAAFPLVLVVGGDMPMLVREVLELLLGSLATSDATAAVLGSGDRFQPLPEALRREPALAAVRDALDRGDRSLLALLEGVRVATVPEGAWRALDPDGATLLDVDVPADLAAGRSAGQARPEGVPQTD